MKLIKNLDEKKKYLDNSDFLSCFSFPVEEIVELFYFESDDYITQEGEEPGYLYYLISGKVKLFLTLPNGKITLIDFFDAPCFIGEMELLGVYHQSRAVQALIPCTCLALPLNKCKHQLLKDVHFLRKMCTYLGTKNMRNVSSLAETKAFPLANRLAAFLLMAAPSGHYKEMHTNTAEYLGVSYRHLLYVMADFVDKDYLRKDRSGYQIINKEALIQLAEEMKDQLKDSHFFANMMNK